MPDQQNESFSIIRMARAVCKIMREVFLQQILHFALPAFLCIIAYRLTGDKLRKHWRCM